MKKLLLAAGIFLLAGIVLFFFYRSNQPAPRTENPSPPVAPAGNGVSTPANSRPPVVAAPAIPAPPAAANPTSPAATPQPQDISVRAGISVPPTTAAASNVPPEAAVRNIRRAVRQYGQMFDGDPVGNNSEITSQLSGKNPRQINFLTGVDGMTVSQNGELVDAWGTPYFFHQLSGSDMEVRSAGPDRKMWTSDDIVTR